MNTKNKILLKIQNIFAVLTMLTMIYIANEQRKIYFSGYTHSKILISWIYVGIFFFIYMLLNSNKYVVYKNKHLANSKTIVNSTFFASILEFAMIFAMLGGFIAQIVYFIQLKSIYARSVIIDFNTIKYTETIAYKIICHIIASGSTYTIIAYFILREFAHLNMKQKYAYITYNHECLKWYKKYYDTFSSWNWNNTKDICPTKIKKYLLIWLYMLIILEWYFLIKTIVLFGYNIYLFRYIHIFNSTFILNLTCYSLLFIFNSHYVHYFQNSILNDKKVHWLKQYYVKGYNVKIFSKRKSSSR